MTKLPANLPHDLPEDWETMQTVAPSGTDVGLTPQHGYNYLMKQVNDVQKASNNSQDAINANTQAIEDIERTIAAISPIKSIQRGFIDESSTVQEYKDVTINPVNLSKSIILVNGGYFGYSTSGGALASSSGAQLLNNTTVRVFANSKTSHNRWDPAIRNLTWQVVEFN